MNIEIGNTIMTDYLVKKVLAHGCNIGGQLAISRRDSVHGIFDRLVERAFKKSILEYVVGRQVIFWKAAAYHLHGACTTSSVRGANQVSLDWTF